MEATIMSYVGIIGHYNGLGFRDWNHAKENGNYCSIIGSILGLYWD